MGPHVVLTSSAEDTARTVFTRLVRDDALADRGGAHRFLATGDPAAFAALAARFLGPRVAPPDVERVPAWA